MDKTNKSTDKMNERLEEVSDTKNDVLTKRFGIPFEEREEKHRVVTWEDIYKDFKLHFPSLCKRVTSWRPMNYATIEIHMIEGEYVKYNYDTKHAEFIPAPKIKIPPEMAKKIKERLGETDE